LRVERMSGLSAEQIDELERRVSRLLENPWDKATGRPRGLTLREALIVTCGYLRHNIVEEVWADVFGVAQSTISRCITLLTPLVKR
jgi:Helix-turn-helix of DDE superfamily endonuclease